jgi:hypothetical protein
MKNQAVEGLAQRLSPGEGAKNGTLAWVKIGSAARLVGVPI